VSRLARRWLVTLSIALIVAGLVTSVIGKSQLRWGAPAVPPHWTARGIHGSPPITTAKPLHRSEPVLISIPRIRVWAPIVPRGLTNAGAVAVPSLRRPFQTSWFDQGPTPGERGTAAVFGHVDTRKVGPAVFYQLGTLRPGDRVYITLHDREVAVFGVYALAVYQKASFPTALVYRYTRWPTLRLITCGGAFDRRTGHYLANIVVFARYIGAHG
jgi:Sortase domain